MKLHNLKDKTLELLGESRENRETIAQKAGVKKDWLNKFASNQIPNPGVDFVQKVHDYLSSKHEYPANN